MTSEEPFAVLRLAPTLDLVAVKSAYFAALVRHPPHQDVEGFQRLRRAYEALTRPGGLALAYLTGPVDVQPWIQAARERFDAPLAVAARGALAARTGAETVAPWVERGSRMSWEEALQAFAP